MEAARLHKLAAQCRRIAATHSSEPAAEALRAMARDFEASAEVCQRLPLIRAHPIGRKRA